MMTKEQQVQSLLDSVRARYSTPKGIAHYEMGARDWGATEWEKEMIRLFMTPPNTVLDVGCGAGRISIELSRMGYVVNGTDITVELLDVARKLAEEFGLEIPFQNCDGLRLDYPDASFQYILLNQMVGNVPLRENRITLFQECARVVSQAGRVVLSYMDNRIVKAKGLYGADKPPDPRAIEKAQDYSVLEPGDVFGNPIRGRKEDGTLDEDPVFGYSHEYTREQIESELADGGLEITELVSAMELSDETTPYYVVSAVPRAATQ